MKLFQISTYPTVFSCLIAMSGLMAPLACGVESPAEQVNTGSVELALTGVGSTGTLYRLRTGEFSITGPVSETFSTETNPDAASVAIDLPAGSYTITLASGWSLERQVSGVWEPIAAQLTSANPANFEIFDQGNTGLQFHFQASGDSVEFGEGTLEVSISVDDQACNPGTLSCDGDASNGCETNVETDPNHCGDCGVACATAPGAMPLCTAGSCELACLPGRADCDMNAATGCETDVSTSIVHCGACDSLCNVPNGAPLCQAGACQVGACNPGFADCDGAPHNGCELSLNTNPACASAASLGSVSGDTASAPIQVSGNSEQRFEVQVAENDLGGSARALSVRFTLTNPPGANYTLEAGCDGCTVNTSGSGAVTLRWDEQTVFGIPTGSDSGRPVFVNVVYNGGSSCANWNLQVQGNVSGGPTTCSSR